jgi:hypothetical protein
MISRRPTIASKTHRCRPSEELICGASELPDDDVGHEARKAIMRIGDAIEEQGLLFLLVTEKNQALPADYREKAREGIDVLRELMRLRGGARE